VIGHDDKNDDIYVIDMWRQQSESNVWIENFINLCLKHTPLMWGEEQGQIMKSLNPFIEKEMIRRRCFTFRQQFTSMHDKTVRARSIQAYMAQKRVFILNKPWADDFVHELLKFPTGRYDDAVDAFGLIGRMLDEMMMRVEKVKKKDDYEYKSGTVMLPGLDGLKAKKKSEFKKF
jgi:predicted phage terminase large subunit-like protein